MNWVYNIHTERIFSIPPSLNDEGRKEEDFGDVFLRKILNIWTGFKLKLVILIGLT